MKKTLANIQDARPFEDLTVAEVGQAAPETVKAVETMIKVSREWLLGSCLASGFGCLKPFPRPLSRLLLTPRRRASGPSAATRSALASFPCSRANVRDEKYDRHEIGNGHSFCESWNGSRECDGDARSFSSLSAFGLPMVFTE